MHISINRKDFLSLLENVQGVIASSRTMPILSNVFIKAHKEGFVEVYGTDLEVSVRGKTKAKVLKEGTAVVESKKLYLFIKELPEGIVNLTTHKNNWLEIVSGKTRANMVGVDVKDYPYEQTKNIQLNGDELKIDATILKDMIEKTVFSVSNDETRYHLNGILFQKDKTNSGHRYRMVSTDGHRLSLVERIEGDPKDEIVEEDKGVIIPRKGVYEIKKTLENKKPGWVLLHISKNELLLRDENTDVLIRLIDGTFPDYRQFLPSDFDNRLTVSRQKLVTSLKVVSVLTDERSRSVTFNVEGERLEITSNDSAKGDAKEELNIEHKGQVIKIGFNARYLLDVLNSFDEDNVSFEFKDAVSPGVIKPELDKNYTCVVMPMRLESSLNQNRAPHARA